MDDKKRDLIPVAAIALFLVIIIALCAVRLHQRRETRAEIAETESTQIWYSEEPAESAESETKDAADQTEETTGEKKQTAERGQQEDEALTEHPDSKLPAGKGKESQGAKQEGNPRTVSGNDPLSGAESANKTNEEMLLEMSGYWEQDNMDAVEDLAMLPWYMRMSSDISDANSFYYYGERSSAGQPDGTGIACCTLNAPVDGIVGHVGCLCLGDDCLQLVVVGRIRAALFDSYGNLSSDDGKDLTLCCVVFLFFMLYVGELRMS